MKVVNGQSCLYFQYEPPAAVNWFLAAYNLPCPNQTPPPSVPPQVLAAADTTWENDITPPSLTISIPPGFALCGMPAYLVTEGPLTLKTSAPTPLGPNQNLTVHAKATYQVDWGDPAATDDTTIYTAPGFPWPSGTVSHTYIFATAKNTPDTVTVTFTWGGTWSLDGYQGTLPFITNKTSLKLNVSQLQDVITYQS